MTSSHLLGAASAAALACLSTGAVAASTIQGGGSTLAQFDYGLGAPNSTSGLKGTNLGEFGTYNLSGPSATFGTYWEAGSGTGQLAFLSDDLTCDISRAQTGTTTCTGSGGANTVDYGASDAVLSGPKTLAGTQEYFWATSIYGQSAAGNLIQLPSIGVGVSIPVSGDALAKDGQIVLTDTQLCGVFSGLITDFHQLDPKQPVGTAFHVVYRKDGSGTTFLLTNHLSDPNVCTAASLKPGFKFSATLTFASLFNSGNGGGSNDGNGTILSGLPGSVPESGSTAIASYMAGYSATMPAVPQPLAVSYLSPDFTQVDAKTSSATLNNDGTKVVSPLYVAGVNSALGIPTAKMVTLGLANPLDGQHLTPPTNATDGANPDNYVPLIQKVKKGYPIVGYTTYDLAQCYTDVNIANSIKAFLALHYQKKGTYATIQKNNGFVSIAIGKAAPFATTIENNILANNSGWNTDIQNASVCGHLIGRGKQ